MLSLLILVLCAIPVFLFYLKYKWDKEDQELGLPGPPTMVLFGNSLDMRKAANEDGDLDKITTKWSQEYGSVFRMRAANTRLVVISDPKLMEQMANNPKIGKPFTYTFFKGWLGDSMVVTSGERWSKLRKLVTPSFHFQILEDFVKIFDEQAKVLVEKIAEANGEVIDVPPYLARFAMDVICETAMGIKCGAQNNDNTTVQYRQACLEVMHIIDQRVLNPLLFNDTIYKLTPTYQEEQKRLKIIHGFVDNVIETRRNEIIEKQKNNNMTQTNDDGITTKKRNALMDLLLQANMDGAALTNDDIRGEVNTFMFAGHDTTTAASQFFMYLMATNPDKQEKLYKEIKELVLDTDEKISIRLLNSLTYLDLCIKESLRMYTPVGGVGKCSEENLKFGDITIPAGDVLLVMMKLNHWNPKYFPEPEKFIPERFSDEVTSTDRNPYVYTPFSFGMRNCIGQRFALLEIKTMVVNVLSNFKIQLGDPNFVPITDYSGVLKSKNGMPLKFIKRT